MRLPVCLATALAISACSSTPSPSLESHAFADFCHERMVRCPDSVEVNQRCVDKSGCIDALINPIHMPAILSCYMAEDCETDSERCLHMPYAEFTPTVAWTNFEPRCTERHRECAIGGVMISDDVCDDAAVSDEYIARVDACLAVSCDQVLLCFAGVAQDFCPAP